jgi:hypothetical protein
MFVVVFGRVGLDALWYGLEMLPHCVGNLLLQGVVFPADLGAGDGGLSQPVYIAPH